MYIYFHYEQNNVVNTFYNVDTLMYHEHVMFQESMRTVKFIGADNQRFHS